MKFRFKVEVFYIYEDECWVAIAPELPGCSAVGKTRLDAVREIEFAADSWVQACKLAGNPISANADPK